MSNESPYGGQDPHPSHDWSPEPPAPPATWSPYGFQTPARPRDDTRPFGFGAPAEGPTMPPQAPPRHPQKRTRGKGLAAARRGGQPARRRRGRCRRRSGVDLDARQPGRLVADHHPERQLGRPGREHATRS